MSKPKGGNFFPFSPILRYNVRPTPVSTDGSEPSESVLDYALQIASDHDATVHILNVADTSRESLTRIQGEVIDVLEREGEQIVDEAAQRATERGISVISGGPSGNPVDIDCRVQSAVRHRSV